MSSEIHIPALIPMSVIVVSFTSEFFPVKQTAQYVTLLSSYVTFLQFHQTQLLLHKANRLITRPCVYHSISVQLLCVLQNVIHT